MPFPYGLQRVTLDDPLVDDDLTHLDALDHLHDGYLQAVYRQECQREEAC